MSSFRRGHFRLRGHGPKGMELALGKGVRESPIVKVDRRKAWHVAAATVRRRSISASATTPTKVNGHPSVVFTVDYYDKGSGIVTLQYHSLEENPQPGRQEGRGHRPRATRSIKNRPLRRDRPRLDDRCRQCRLPLRHRQGHELSSARSKSPRARAHRLPWPGDDATRHRTPRDV